jgi:hypothetical protein
MYAFNVGCTVFFWQSPGSNNVNKEKLCSQVRHAEIEPSFKEFLTSPEIIGLDLMPIKPDVGCMKYFKTCYSLRFTLF